MSDDLPTNNSTICIEYTTDERPYDVETPNKESRNSTTSQQILS